MADTTLLSNESTGNCVCSCLMLSRCVFSVLSGMNERSSVCRRKRKISHVFKDLSQFYDSFFYSVEKNSSGFWKELYRNVHENIFGLLFIRGHLFIYSYSLLACGQINVVNVNP